MTITPDIAKLIEAKKKNLGKIVDTASDRVLQTWVGAWDDIDADLARLDLTGTQKQREARLLLARSRASEQILQLATETASLVNDAALDLIEQAIVDQPELIAAQLPPQMGAGSLLRPPGEELSAITARVQEQVTARAYWLSVASTESMRRALVLGVAAGDNPRETARRMVANAEDAFNGGLARAMVIARTETLDAYRTAAQASQDANSDVLAGWRWMASLSGRTCPSCIAQHGTLYPLDEPGPLDHHQGRCYRAPVTKTWRELGYNMDEPNKPVETGADWFNRQPESVQRDILGPARFEAWKDGDYPVDGWSQRRSTADWRDAYHTTPAPKPGTGLQPTLPDDPLNGLDLDTMSDDDLDNLMAKLGEQGDWVAAERVGEHMDARMAAPARPVPPQDPAVIFSDDGYTWFDNATEQEQFDLLDLLDASPWGGSDMFLQEHYAWKAGREALDAAVPTVSRAAKERAARAAYEDFMHIEQLRLEAATNGFMLTPEARAAGRTWRDLYRVNDQTAAKWATDETRAYWNANGGRMTFRRHEILSGETGPGFAEARERMAKGAMW